MRRGFTLAEVLITLGIIGVVAAITIPTLINSTNKAEFATAYKKSYSVFSNAFAYIKKENGDSVKSLCGEYTDENLASSKCLSDIFKPYLQVARACETGNSSDCSNMKTVLTSLSGDTTIRENMGNDMVAFVLNDGSVVFFDFPGINSNCSAHDATECFTMIFDTNGNKKPNKIGLDVHLIWGYPDRIVLPETLSGSLFKCDSSIPNNGSQDAQFNGLGCGTLLLNGQSIP